MLDELDFFAAVGPDVLIAFLLLMLGTLFLIAGVRATERDKSAVSGLLLILTIASFYYPFVICTSYFNFNAIAAFLLLFGYFIGVGLLVANKSRLKSR